MRELILRAPRAFFVAGMLLVSISTPVLAGNAGAIFGNILGNLIKGAVVQEAVKSWNAVGRPVQYCLIQHYGIQPRQLAARGIRADDQRVVRYVRACQQAVAEARYRAQQQMRAMEAARAAQEAAEKREQQQEAAQEAAAKKAEAAREAAAEAAAEKHHKELVAKYGSKDADAIESGTVLIGMPKSAVRAALGPPPSVETIPPDDEMWVYGSKRIAISDGKVTYVGH